MRTTSRVAGLLALATLLGCTSDDPSESVANQEIGGCPAYVCGNSPEIDSRGFHDLHLLGEQNAGGLRMELGANGRAVIRKGGLKYDLYVINGKLFGSFRDRFFLEGQALVGAEIRLIANGVVAYRVGIGSVRDIPYYVGKNPPLELEAYVFKWVRMTASLKSEMSASSVVPNICTRLVDPSDGDKPGLYGMQPDETILFEGDRVDTARKEIDPAYDENWFNLGCAGHTLSKLHLTGNSSIWDRATASARWAARQATLKLLTADYCGNGEAFTVAGEKLLWKSDVMAYWATPDRVEARWGPKGATCLNEPRVRVSPLPLAQAMFPDIEQAIAQSCQRPPTCANDDFNDFDGNERISSNPAAPY